ncbi:hypothetical protein [Sphingomonas melonis]|uniref:hypothetical protein n=1 Tax=Sphingomonas melonis TaxID=152682 RepID=UPI0007A5DFDF|nr:hypothetical protein [Sphingomonas melonis]
MQHPHIPSREQADASLASFYKHLGHRPPTPRLIRPTRLVAPRVLRERRLALWSRTLDIICVIALVAIGIWVGLPVAMALLVGGL